MKVIFDGHVIADSAKTKVVEGNHYFPPDSIKKEYFEPSAKKTMCGWKGEASYYTLKTEGKTAKDAAWYYPATKEGPAKDIEGHVAFYKMQVAFED